MYVINLPARTDRLEAYKQSNSHLQFDIVSGVPKDEAQRQLDSGLLVLHKPLITKGEIGCFLAHINVWRKIALDPWIASKDFVLISEDDVVYGKDFYSLLEILKQHIPEEIRFVNCVDTKKAEGIITVVEPVKLDRTTTASYLIRKDLAMELVKRFDNDHIIYIADMFSTYLSEPLGCTNLGLVTFSELSQASDIMPEVHERIKFLIRSAQDE